MKSTIYLLSSILAALTLGSCTQRIYLPGYANAPFLQEKHEANLTTTVKMPGESDDGHTRLSTSTDAAFAITDNIGVIASFRHTNKYATENFTSNSTGSHDDSVVYSGNVFEAGAGYFMPINRKGHFEVYAGGGYGHLNRDNINIIQGYQTDYARFFIQPAIGFFHKDIIEFGGGARLAYQRYFNFHGGDETERFEYTKSKTDIEKITLFMIEPFVQFSAGFKYVKFNIQSGFSANLSSPILRNPFLPYVSMGLKFSLAPRYSK